MKKNLQRLYIDSAKAFKKMVNTRSNYSNIMGFGKYHLKKCKLVLAVLIAL